MRQSRLTAVLTTAALTAITVGLSQASSSQTPKQPVRAMTAMIPTAQRMLPLEVSRSEMREDLNPVPLATTTTAPRIVPTTTVPAVPTTSPAIAAPVRAQAVAQSGAVRSIDSTGYSWGCGATGNTASGQAPHYGGVASHVLPLGTTWRVLDGPLSGQVFTVNDTGPGATFDIFMSSCATADNYGRRVIEIQPA